MLAMHSLGHHEHVRRPFPVEIQMTMRIKIFLFIGKTLK
jgi:hypothetical protein